MEKSIFAFLSIFYFALNVQAQLNQPDSLPLAQGRGVREFTRITRDQSELKNAEKAQIFVHANQQLF